MKCPCCGGAELVRDTRDMFYACKGETTAVLAVTGDFCPACGEVILDRENGDRYMREISFFSKDVDARR
ncbi:type II toxin-antitoxin system MqsA family antitoxin [Zoogloea sp.]|uniref:type II toxin-antitoxin system MqsA family antitoxin n=1 Tax=Zoogloea sp. TaxID=49181 RepID=UPI002B509CC9|nr:type II toxin-antitoxin system MqsA family antitoxin [Rhodocyclaceae bacterium]